MASGASRRALFARLASAARCASSASAIASISGSAPAFALCARAPVPATGAPRVFSAPSGNVGFFSLGAQGAAAGMTTRPRRAEAVTTIARVVGSIARRTLISSSLRPSPRPSTPRSLGFCTASAIAAIKLGGAFAPRDAEVWHRRELGRRGRRRRRTSYE